MKGETERFILAVDGLAIGIFVGCGLYALVLGNLVGVIALLFGIGLWVFKVNPLIKSGLK